MKIPTISIELWLEGWRTHHQTGNHVSFVVDDEALEHFKLATVAKGKVAGQRYAAVLVEIAEDEQPAVPATPPPPKPPKPESKEAKAAREQAEFNAKTGDLLAVAVTTTATEVPFEKQPDGSFARDVPLGTPGGVVQTTDAPITGDEIPEEWKKHRGFPAGLTGLAVQWCLDPHFQTWIVDHFPDVLVDSTDDDGEKLAKAIICSLCGIDSRKDLDTVPEAATAFRQLVMEPYAKRRAADEVDDEDKQPLDGPRRTSAAAADELDADGPPF